MAIMDTQDPTRINNHQDEAKNEEKALSCLVSGSKEKMIEVREFPRMPLLRSESIGWTYRN